MERGLRLQAEIRLHVDAHLPRQNIPFSAKVQIVMVVLPANSELLLALGGATWVGIGVSG